MECKISVIIPVYNAEKTIARCVESLLYGKFKELEVILVDDCSTDSSWLICEKYAKQFQSVYAVKNDCNHGVSYTRNHGLSLAKGKYVLFVDSDDWVSCDYADLLYSTGISHPESLTLCGFKFIDSTENYSRSYIYNVDKPISKVTKDKFFTLMDCVHLQVVWNKLFRRDIIANYNVCFDESQRMGEDFQFVLDYVEAAGITQCAVINQELLYYTRYKNNSLMSNFSIEPFDTAMARINRLAVLCDHEQSSEQWISQMKENRVYHIVRNCSLNTRDKIAAIELLWKDGSAKKRYQKQKALELKENLVKLKSAFVRFPSRVYGRLQRNHRQRIINKVKRMNHCQTSFTVISQNCIGGVFYHDMGLPFDSPTINLYFDAADYLRFVNNLQYYMSLPLEMQWGEEYPIGMLGDVKIYFMHYDTCTEAFESWNRRAQRIHWDKIVVLDTDRNGFGEQEYNMWRNISYPKLLFTVHPDYNKDSVLFPEYEDMGYVPDLIPKREFYRDEKLLKLINSL